MRSRAGAALLVVLAAGGCGGRGAPHIHGDDARSSDVFELRTTIGGGLASVLGSAHEWYSPRDGLFRVVHPVKSETFRMTYDGRTVTRRLRAGVVRVTASDPRAMRAFTEQLSIFVTPGIYVTKLYLGQLPPDKTVRVNTAHGGRELEARWHYQDENGVDLHVPIRVEVLSRRPLDRGVFRPFRGKLVGAFRQVPPGTRALYGNEAWWFGPRLGPAHAVTSFERFGRDPWLAEDEPPRGHEYQTVYRLPRSTFPPGERPPPDPMYPGFGSHTDLQVYVSCDEGLRGPGFGVAPGTRPERIRLGSGERATIYVNAFSVRYRQGVDATILVDRTTCFIHGVIAPREFRRLAPSLERAR